MMLSSSSLHSQQGETEGGHHHFQQGETEGGHHHFQQGETEGGPLHSRFFRHTHTMSALDEAVHLVLSDDEDDDSGGVGSPLAPPPLPRRG